MAELETVARPYAEALFSMAMSGGSLDAWSDALAALTAVVTNDDGAALIRDPLVEGRARADTIIAVMGDDVGAESANFIRLLADKSRLELAPQIADVYERLYADEQNTVDVDVRTASALDQTQSDKLKAALETRLSKTVRLCVTEDDNVLGGAVITAGDLVFDHTISGQLERLNREMAH